jgi:short-subunit dehydrogenase
MDRDYGTRIAPDTGMKREKPLKVLITGGSRGLGLELALRLARQGASLFLCARDEAELKRASEKIAPISSRVKTQACDVSDPRQVRELIRQVSLHFGTVDLLINSAGKIQVGPLASLDFGNFEEILDTNLVGMIRTTLLALPHMRRGSRIVNITSIGGAVAIPHLLPYSTAKFGALGFSLGLDSELASRGISVTSVLPGLMRTGSFVQAKFHGNAQKEFDWFALGATLPLVSISAESAARQILSAARRRKRLAVIGPQAKLLRSLYQAFPGAMLGAMRLVARLLPEAPSASRSTPHAGIPGKRLRKDLPRGGVTILGDRAGDELNENPAA